jgi:threonine synthase
MSYVSALVFGDTGERLAADAQPESWLGREAPRVRYDLEAIRRQVDRDRLSESPVHGRAGSMWRYAPLLPLDDPDRAVTLGEGGTPLLSAPALSRALGLGRLQLKDEGRNPSGTFKDRGASASVSRLRELGVERVVLASSGNAGAAWSLYAARGGLDCLAILPADALPPVRAQCRRAGATVRFVDGDWAEAPKFVHDAARRDGRLDVGTLREPWRLEGKKTMGFEIAEQLGFALPDVLVYPTGGGLGPIAIYKAFRELVELGWVSGPLPRLVVTQYEGCAPIVRAWREGTERVAPWGEIRIPPGGLKAARPPGGDEVLALLRETGGAAFDVSSADAFDAVGRLAALEGVFACPESATTLVGLERARERGLVGSDERIVVVITGHGLKSVDVLPEPAMREGGRGSGGG